VTGKPYSNGLGRQTRHAHFDKYRSPT